MLGGSHARYNTFPYRTDRYDDEEEDDEFIYEGDRPPRTWCLFYGCLVWILLITFVATVSRLQKSHVKPPDVDFENWIATTKKVALKRLLDNVSPEGTLNGCIVASPSKNDPDYWYNWIRDGALVANVLIQEYENLQDKVQITHMENILWDYINFNSLLSKLPTRSSSKNDPRGLGEPKYNVDGTAFNGEWGRPQNDGPALRSRTLIRFAREFLKKGGDINRVKQYIYDSALPTNTLLKMDLEMVASTVNLPCFDLWEETYGKHFYTTLVGKRALLEGSNFALFMNDTGASIWYYSKTLSLDKELAQYWNETVGYIQASKDTRSSSYKASNMDAAVVLASLHSLSHETAETDELGNNYQPWDPRIKATMKILKDTFREIYPINHDNVHLPPMIGRYPEDRYYGGNPWFITTLAFAEAGYIEESKGKSSVSDESDGYLKMVRLYMTDHMDEQVDKITGNMTSAKDLTWSYAAFLSAVHSRDMAKKM